MFWSSSKPVMADWLLFYLYCLFQNICAQFECDDRLIYLNFFSFAVVIHVGYWFFNLPTVCDWCEYCGLTLNRSENSNIKIAPNLFGFLCGQGLKFHTSPSLSLCRFLRSAIFHNSHLIFSIFSPFPLLFVLSNKQTYHAAFFPSQMGFVWVYHFDRLSKLFYIIHNPENKWKIDFRLLIQPYDYLGLE